MGRFASGSLDAISWIDRLTEAARNDLERFMRIASVRQERTIYYQEDPADDAYLVIEGSVRRLKWTDSGTTVLLGRSQPGEWIGLAEAFVQGVYLCDAITDCECKLASIHASDLLRLIDHKSLRREIIHALSAGYYALHGVIEAHSPAAKIATYLCALNLEEKQHRSSDVDSQTIEVTQESIAQAVGLSRETVNRHLQELATSHVLSLSRGRIRIIDIARLRALASITGSSTPE